MNSKDLLLRSKYDFEFFCKNILGMVFEEHHRKIANLLLDDSKRFVVIEVARGHGKTYLLKAYNLWRSTFYEGRKSCIISSAKEQSWDVLLDLKRIIENNEHINFLRPSLSRIGNKKDDKWSASHIITSTECSTKSLPFNSTIRGQHVNELICDDILRDVNTGTIPEDKQKKLFAEAVSPVVNTLKGKLIIVGTPQTDTDIIAISKEILEEFGRAGDFLSLPAVEIDDKGNWIKPLWKKDEVTGLGFTLDELRKIRIMMNKMSPFSFEKEYLLQPSVGEQSIFKPDVIKRQTVDKDLKIKNDDLVYFMGVDIAMSSSTVADFTVHYIIGADENNNVYACQYYREKGMKDNEILIRAQELDGHWKCNGIMMEQVGLSYGLVNTAIEEKFFLDQSTGKSVMNKIQGIVEGFNTSGVNKPRLISQLQSALENGTLFIPNDDLLIKELLSFRSFKRNDKYKLEGVGAHDDIVMALALAYEAYLTMNSMVVAETI